MTSEVLPHFAQPPVTRVVLGLAFEPLPKLRASHLGVFWDHMNSRGGFPLLDEFEHSTTIREHFDELGNRSDDNLALEALDSPAVPRVVMSSSDGHSQIAVQDDLLQVSWLRANDGQPYPRYEWVRDRFSETFASWQAFLGKQEFGLVRPVQADVSYSNDLRIGSAPDTYSAIPDVVRFQTLPTTAGQDVENFHYAQRHVLRDAENLPWARLHVHLDCRRSKGPELQPLLVLRVRGPVATDDEAFAFFDRAHRVIVTSFVEATPPSAHLKWGKIR